MMRHPIRTLFSAACSWALGAVPAGAAAVRAERLVPANFAARTDALGFSWDVTSTGAIKYGTNGCFSNALVLTVNGCQFNSPGPMMTADGSEYVLTAGVAGVEVTRRVKVLPKASITRYVEVFENRGNSPLALTVTLQTKLSSQCQLVMSDSGAPNPTSLGKKECGLLALRQQGSRPSVVFWLAGTRSRVKPGIVNNQNYNLTFSYSLTVGAGKTVALLHGVAQRRINAIPDVRALQGLFAPFMSRKWMRGLPRKVRRTIANTGRLGYAWGADFQGSMSLENLGVSRGKTDILALGGESRLSGAASCEHLSVETRYGPKAVPFEDVAAMVGGKPSAGGGRLYLRDGQVFCGELKARGLRFTLNSGFEMSLSGTTAGVLAMRVVPGDGEPARDAVAFVETFGGDRLAVAGGPSASLTSVTPWGPLEIPLDELRWLSSDGESPGHRIRLRDGSSFFAFLDDSPLALKTLSFGVREFRPGDIRAIETVRGGREEADERIARPHLVLVGGNVLVGMTDLPAVNLVAAGQVVPLPPGQIRVMHNLSEENGAEAGGGTVFCAEMWGGGTLVGRLHEAILPVRVRGVTWQVPARDIVDVFVTSPTVPGALRERIAGLIRGLGHPDWKEREKASRELAALGFVAKEQLNEARKVTTDAEVRRRAQVLLDGIE